MVMVAMGPAATIEIPSEEANSSGSQFFVDQPGMEQEAKKKRIVQKAMFPSSIPSEERMPRRPWAIVFPRGSFSSMRLAAGSEVRFS